MTTRNFLKSMLLAAVAPQVLIAAAEDRYRWKVNADLIGAGLSHRPGFQPQDFYGKWRFVEYRRLPSGLWTKTEPKLEPFSISEPDFTAVESFRATFLIGEDLGA